MSFLSLENKNIVIFGLANKKSIAFHVGKTLSEEKANVILVVHSEKSKLLAESLFPKVPVFICDVGIDANILEVKNRIQEKYKTIHGLVHSIAFANYGEKLLPFHEIPKADFLQSIDISCFSLLSISNHFQNLLSPEASVVALSISTTRMASENYGFMAPVKAALDSSVCFLAKSFSRFSKVRFNTVNAGLLKTKSSAGIPNYVTSYLFAEQLTLRKEALKTEEVANAVVFLLSPASSGINASFITLDAGMSVNYFDREIIEKAMKLD